MRFRQPTMLQLLEQELYQAEREVLGQEERAFRLSAQAVQAQALLDACVRRCNQLRAQVVRLKAPQEAQCAS